MESCALFQTAIHLCRSHPQMTDKFESGDMNRGDKIAEFDENSLLSNREIQNMEVDTVYNDEGDNEDLRNR